MTWVKINGAQNAQRTLTAQLLTARTEQLLQPAEGGPHISGEQPEVHSNNGYESRGKRQEFVRP